MGRARTDESRKDAVRIALTRKHKATTDNNHKFNMPKTFSQQPMDAGLYATKNSFKIKAVVEGFWFSPRSCRSLQYT
jgi:hypothetical protein